MTILGCEVSYKEKEFKAAPSMSAKAMKRMHKR